MGLPLAHTSNVGIEKRVAIVTGAGQGMGEAFAKILADGLQVILEHVFLGPIGVQGAG